MNKNLSSDPEAQTVGEGQDAIASDLLSSCVHCGFCLEVCPTYELSGDENNSPRGRLRLWREEATGELPEDPWTAHYTSECVGCLACETACPANVPYGRIMESVRHQHVARGRHRPPRMLRWAAAAIRYPRVFQLCGLPIRLFRRLGLVRHRNVFAGRPAFVQSTAEYARQLVARHRPTGPRVALLSGCLMEAAFREINFATIRVLVENNIQVIVPSGQTCCGAFLEHLGADGVADLQQQNRRAFLDPRLDVEAILSNSAGCGLALARTLSDGLPVRDVLEFLGDQNLVSRDPRPRDARVYVDLPCHLIHGQRVEGIAPRVLDATGYAWELAPRARDCCGSGGVYHIEHPENARAILAGKADFLNHATGDPVVLATSNHVCMMQWHSARATGLVNRPFEVRHIVQLLDPGEDALPVR